MTDTPYPAWLSGALRGRVVQNFFEQKEIFTTFSESFSHFGLFFQIFWKLFQKKWEKIHAIFLWKKYVCIYIFWKFRLLLWLLQRASQSSLQLQLAPSLEHQTAAMLSILERYKWHQFSVVTTQIAGHDDFIQAVRERITEVQDRFK